MNKPETSDLRELANSTAKGMLLSKKASASLLDKPENLGYSLMDASLCDKGKPGESRGRKATGLS